MTHTLVVRLDNAGDVLLAGPAVRAVAAGSDRVTLLCGPRGAAAGELLPGVDSVITWRSPWIDPEPDPVSAEHVEALVAAVRDLAPDRALVLTSFHQSPLPTALALRLAGVPWVGAASDDYPGSLLDLRHRPPDGLHEVERGLSLARAAGHELPPDDDGRLAVRRAPAPRLPLPDGPYVVLHPGTSVPARAWPADGWGRLAQLLAARGHRVVVTGGPGEQALTRAVAAAGSTEVSPGNEGGRLPGDPGPGVVDLGGRTDLAELSDVLARAAVVVVGNTGPAHLAAAVGTPVVSLFAPTVPFERWRPWGVPVVALGRGDAPCRGTRVTRCPFPGHPCLSSVGADEVARAVDSVVPPPGTRDRRAALVGALPARPLPGGVA
ncbi:MAG: glycosyltransferase family 9 protein [Dermatophilaceae bacterium]|nr:glycosyltransferase family 9 protein [Dermatophilaceae bacterium]